MSRLLPVRVIPLTLVACGVLAGGLPACGGPDRSEGQDPPSSGRVSYLRHCASCHGESGRGDGPLASALETPPADLTTLARRNDGRFDERTVMAFISGERHVEAHGPREMPVWGAVFRRENETRERPWPSYVAFLEIRSLVDHIRTLQVE